MKKYLLVILGLSFFSFFVQAAYDDVSLTTDARIGLTGDTLSVSGATAYVQSIDVTSDSFTATLVPGSGGSSSLKVSSPSLYKFTHNVTPQSAYVDAEVCNSSESSVTFAPSGGKTIQVTVQLDTASPKCSGGSSGSSGGGGGGGGGGGTQQPVKPPETPPVQPQAPISIPAAVVFTRSLSLGSVHSDVKRLQELLNSDSDTRVAETGFGSPGKETSYFGALTKKAVGKFQLKYKVISADTDSGYGLVGPKTRAKLQEVFSKGALPAGEQAKLDALKAELARLIQLLQNLLKQQGR